jgi:hypothetical protein
VESLKRELQREKERYDDLMALFRATQVNQSVNMQQQQRPMQMPVPSQSSSGQPFKQEAIPGLASLQPQQQSAMQQWPNTGGTSSAYMANYDWTSN